MTKIINEKFLCLTGQWHHDRLWSGRGRWPLEGQPFQVSFNSIYDHVVSRETIYRDVIGFYHTHPNMPATPSSTDYETMNQWSDVLGKDVLCLIHGSDGLKTYLWLGDSKYKTGKTIKLGNRFMGVIYE
jgi:hypothetical protein